MTTRTKRYCINCNKEVKRLPNMDFYINFCGRSCCYEYHRNMSKLIETKKKELKDLEKSFLKTKEWAKKESK